MGVLVERIGRDQSGRELHGVRAFPDASARNAPSRRTASPSPGAPALTEQPCGEPWAPLDVHALEEFPAEAGELDGLARSSVHEHANVESTLWQTELHHVAAPDGIGTAQETSKLRQVPSQGACRVVRIGEEEVDQLLPRRGPVREREVREEAPDLPTSWPASRGRVHDSSRTSNGGPRRWTAIPMEHPASPGCFGQGSLGRSSLTRTVTRAAVKMRHGRATASADGPEHRRGSMSTVVVDSLREQVRGDVIWRTTTATRTRGASTTR